MLHKEAVTPELISLASMLSAMPELASYRMVGGTAIALHLGHRKSIDIDFFSNESTDKSLIRKVFLSQFPETQFFISPDHLSAVINGIRLELYDEWMIPFRSAELNLEGLRLASLADLAAFKLSAVTGRREKKDYIDLYFLFDALGMENVLSQFKLYDPLLSPKSILFALAEVKTAERNQSPMPEMLQQVSWAEINSSMQKAGELFLQLVRDND